MRYVKGTIDERIFHSSSSKLELVGYIDSDWAGETETRKSTSGYVFHLGAGVFSRCSKKQQVVALSTAEAEYIAATNYVTQAVWLRRILSELQHQQNGPTKIFCDNKSIITLTKNTVFHGRSKHINIKHHYIRDLIKDKEIVVELCISGDQLAYIFTKPLKVNLFIKLKKMLRMMKPS